MKKKIFDFSLQELHEYLEKNYDGTKKYHSNEIFKWIYKRKILNFNEMTNLPRKLRLFLSENLVIENSFLELIETDETDKAIKLKILLNDGLRIESVIITTEKRRTLCISSQVGCAMGCSFCCTSKMGFKRNLKTDEIISQLIIAEKVITKSMGTFRQKEKKLITNLVFMGMGEPLHNLDALGKAILIFEDQMAFAYSKRKITVSTCGICDRILEIPKWGDPNLAISLNAVNDVTRNCLMPVNKKYNIEKLFETLKNYPLDKGRRITFEYILIEGINDSIEEAKVLVKLMKKVPSKLNLICFNPFKGSVYRKPDEEKVRAFLKFMLGSGVQTNLRESKGKNISAACGQLVS